MNSVKECYSTLNIPSDSFNIQLTKNEEVFNILCNVSPEKACGLDETPCRMLKDGAEILFEPIFQIANMSLGSNFGKDCKTATVRTTFKNRKIQNQKITDLFHFCL